MMFCHQQDRINQRKKSSGQYEYKEQYMFLIFKEHLGTDGITAGNSDFYWVSTGNKVIVIKSKEAFNLIMNMVTVELTKS